MTTEEFLENKYPVNENYHQQMTLAKLNQCESEFECYHRSHTITSNVLKMHEEHILLSQQGQLTPQEDLHILFVGMMTFLFSSIHKNKIFLLGTCSKFRNVYT